MKRILAVIFSAMAIGGVTVTPALASSDMPKWEASVTTFMHTLKRGMNPVDLTSGALVFIEKDGDTLYAWATSAEQRGALSDGTYQLRGAKVSECDVKSGIVAACR